MKIETIQITSDAFYWLRDGEEMIDTDNEEEAQEIVEMFRPHFEFISEPIPVDGTDMVEVKISVGDRHILAGTSVADFTPLPNKKVQVHIFDTANLKKPAERNQIQDLEPIGDKYWAECRYYEKSKCHDFLPVCKISEYEKLFL